jgi:hypothetical protein
LAGADVEVALRGESHRIGRRDHFPPTEAEGLVAQSRNSSVERSHHALDCTFETMLKRDDLADPVLWDMARTVHEADCGYLNVDGLAAIAESVKEAGP